MYFVFETAIRYVLCIQNFKHVLSLFFFFEKCISVVVFHIMCIECMNFCGQAVITVENFFSAKSNILHKFRKYGLFLLSAIYFPTLTDSLSMWIKKNSKQYNCTNIYLKYTKGCLET